MQCILYARVSTDRQVDRGLSLPAQLAAMRQYAATRQWTVLEEFIDEGLSGRSTDRAQLQAVMSRCRIEPHVDVLLVHKLDRLARNVYDHAAIRALLKKQHVQLASVVEQIDESITGTLVEHIMAAIAEFYSANLAQETQKGMRMRIEQGGWPFRAPRGYRNRRTPEGRPVIEVEPREAEAVRRIFELYASGSRSFHEVAAMIDREGLPPVTPATHFRRLLTNPFYVGIVRWHGVEHQGNHEPLVSQELFDRVGHTLSVRRQAFGRRPADQFFLRGLLTCDTCGKRLTAEQHGRWSYYKCWAHKWGSPYFNAERVHRDLEHIYHLIEIETVRQILVECVSESARASASLTALSAELDADGRARLARTLFASMRVREDVIASYELNPIRTRLSPAA